MAVLLQLLLRYFNRDSLALAHPVDATLFELAFDIPFNMPSWFGDSVNTLEPAKHNRDLFCN